MIGMTHSEDKRTEELYRKLGVPVSPDISVHFIWLPLLEKLVSQLERVDVINNVTRDYTFKESECVKSSRRPVKKSEVD